MQITVRQIQTFLLVQREGSFAAAARRLNISHVAVSKQIATLERIMGGDVFERRTGAKVALNGRGRVLLEKAPELLEKLRELNTELRSNSEDITTVRVAAGNHILTSIFYPNMGNFHQAHRDIQIEFLESDPALETVGSMSNNQLDLGYFTLPAQAQPSTGTLLATVSAGLYASPKTPWALTWRNDHPEPLPLLSPLAGSYLDRLMRKSLTSAHLTHYRIAAHVQQETGRRELAVAGIGAILTMTESVQALLDAGKLIEMTQAFPRLYLERYVFRNPTSHSPQVNAVEQYLSSLIRAVNECSLNHTGDNTGAVSR